ncbi:toxin-antitoxin system, toxin component [Streptomyces sp. NPDC050523]|uniref:toxin-antitoxin system, toxin component n=1 Tax=Streptomyces sp. NPDC050523 TaxID=3365622 RepID=UPI0037A717DB
MRGSTTKALAKQQRKLLAELGAAVEDAVDIPAEPHVVFEAVCQAMSARRGGRPVTLSIRPFPEGMAHTTGLWLDLEDQDLIVVEEHLAPDHQLVVLGHELWHIETGEGGHNHLGGAAVAARAALSDQIDWLELARQVAARAHSHQEDEVAAEGFGLLLGNHMKTWLAVPGTTRQLDDEVARRIRATLGYRRG